MTEARRMVRRLYDGALLHVLEDRGGTDICVEEMFEFADGGPSPRPLRIWGDRTRYEYVDGPADITPVVQ